MSFFQAKLDWLLIVVFYILMNNTLHCTFRSVTGSFNASLMATFDKTTEEECMSKCSMVLECTFMEYNEGTCKTFKYGTEVQELSFASKAFAYSFDEKETSCPTATVLKPQSSTKKSIDAKKSIEDICNGTHKLAEWEAVTKKSLIETPNGIRTCLFSPSSSHLNSCTLTVCLYRLGTSWRYATDEDYLDLCESERPFACADYNAESPYAVATYLCSNRERFIVVIDTEAKPNSEFPKFAELDPFYSEITTFYVQKVNCSAD